MFALKTTTVALLLVLVGCGSSGHDTLHGALPVTPAAPEPLAPSEPSRLFEPAKRDALGAELGRFRITYYWIAQQRDAGRSVVLRDASCKKLARVSSSFARRLRMQGTGRLRDGRLVNIAGGCKCSGTCFFVANGKRQGWGVGVRNRPLRPFRSIAVDPRLIPIGSWVYVEELDGLLMPGTGDYGAFVHDGCVVADDRGGGIDGRHIDFFAANREHYYDLNDKQDKTRVTIRHGGKHCMSHDAARTANNQSTAAATAGNG